MGSVVDDHGMDLRGLAGDLMRERDDLKDQLAAARAEADIALKASRDGVEYQMLLRALAELARIRPVYDAAVKWKANEDEINKLIDDTAAAGKHLVAEWKLLDALRIAIDTATPPATKGDE